MSSRVFWGVLLVAFGGLVLLSNLGVVPWGIWTSFWRTWPLLLVAWGVAIVLHPLGRRGAFLAGFLALAAAIALVGIAYATHPDDGAGQAQQAGELALAQPLAPGVERVDFEMDFGAGTVDLDGDAPEGQLALGTLGYLIREPEVRYTERGAEATLRLSAASGSWVGSIGGRMHWEIHLSPVPVYALDMDTGACSTEFDLSTLKVADLDLDTGASECSITFGDLGLDTTARMSFGAASVTLRVPRSLGVRVNLSSGLVGSNLKALGFAKAGETWLSPDYEARPNHLDLRVQAGASSFNLEWID